MSTNGEPARRRGPRPGGRGSRAAIVEAARSEFAAKGYDGATLRGIARSAGVDPRLVHHYFDGKSSIFRAALQLPVDLPAVLRTVFDGPVDQLAERALRTFFRVWDAPESTGQLVAFVMASTSADEGARTLQQFLTHELLSQVSALAAPDDPELRASLVASQMLGLVMARYVLRMQPLASADPEDVIPFLAPTLQRYLSGDVR